jgi:hypothetical protein
MVYMQSGVLNDYIRGECLNLIRFLNTVKIQYWQDWNEHVTQKDNARATQ